MPLDKQKAYTWCACIETCAPRALTFTVGSDAAVLAQGETASLGGFRAETWVSWEGEGVSCPDAPGAVYAWALVAE